MTSSFRFSPRVLLLNDNSEHPNWGAQATPYAIKRMFSDHFPEAQLECITYGWLAARYRKLRIPFHEGITFRERNFGPARFAVYGVTRLEDPYPEIWDDFEFYADRWVSGEAGPFAAEFVERLKRSDALVHNGENSLYRNTVPGMRALFLLWLAKTRFGKIAAEINHTAVLADMTRPIMRGIAREVLPMLDLVTARELRSLDDLRKLGITNAEAYPDAVFYLGEDFDSTVPGVKRAGPTPDGPYFCLSASALPMSEPREGSPGAVAALVQSVSKLGLRPVLLAKDPHCQYMREIAEQSRGVFFGPDHIFAELWPLFRRAELLITGHYHYAIIASQVGCPFIPLSTNNHKMAGVVSHLGWHLEEPFDATALRPVIEQIVAEAKRLYENREFYSQRLAARAGQMKHESAQHVLRLREILSDKLGVHPLAAVNA
jgi:polysaccharide pyruvyl transferase WcaK-like protein